MTIRRVWDGATGAGDGSTWTDAYTTLTAVLAAWVANDVIWMASDHYESFSGADKVYNWTGDKDEPTHIYSIARGDDSYTIATSAQLETTTDHSVYFQDVVLLYGLYLKGGDSVWMASDRGLSEYHDCVFEFASQGSAVYGLRLAASLGFHYVRDCTIKSLGSYSMTSFVYTAGGRHLFENCTMSGLSSGLGPLITAGSGGVSRYVGCDFSGVTDPGSMSVANNGAEVLFQNCKLYPSWYLGSISTLQYPNRRVESLASGIDGATTANLYTYVAQSNQAAIDHTTTIYRDDGYQDVSSGTRLAHIIDPVSVRVSSDNAQMPESMPMSVYVDSTGSKTIRIEALHDYTTAPTKDELWIEVSYLGTSDSCLASTAGGRSIFSTANWATSTVAWTGSGGYSKIKLEQAITMNRPGVVSVVLYLGKYEINKELIYCPKVEVD